MQLNSGNQFVEDVDSPRHMSLIVYMVCFYIFLFIERPWETISHLQGIQIERWYAALMLIIAFLHQKLIIAKSPTNKWVYTLLSLHFLLAPFAYSSGFAVNQGIEYGKMVVLYLLMLAVVDDEGVLKYLLKAYLLSTLIYSLHSLLEYSNGRHQYRMGISRMVGADWSDPNAFGATLVLSLPLTYVLIRFEENIWFRRAYYVYYLVVVTCVVLTGSRSAFVAMVVVMLLWAVIQEGKRKFSILVVVLLSFPIVWHMMPEEKQTRIITLWDEDAGPANAQVSAEGRKVGWQVSKQMFKQKPWTGVGAGGENFVGYRLANRIDELLGYKETPLQAHVLYGQVIAEFGIPGTLCLTGLVFSVCGCCIRARRKLVACGIHKSFLGSLSGAILLCLLLLLIFGFAGHNFYRPLWLWLAAWSGAVLTLSEKVISRRVNELSDIHG